MTLSSLNTTNHRSSVSIFHINAERSATQKDDKIVYFSQENHIPTLIMRLQNLKETFEGNEAIYEHSLLIGFAIL